METKYNGDSDAITAVKKDLTDVKDILIKNVEKVIDRQEKLEVIVQRTEELQGTSSSFNRAARGLRREEQWNQRKLVVYVVLFGVFVLYVLGGWACGFPLWSKCV